MNSIVLTDNQFNPQPTWDKPVAKLLFKPTSEDVDLFDQNGYDLTILEQHYARANQVETFAHRQHIQAVKQPWFTQSNTITGAVLSHSLLFERKAYSGAALTELKHWARELPLLHKLTAMRSKWGLDFSMDYVDELGNAFELLHWEWDSFDLNEIQQVKSYIEPVLLNIDWTQAAQDMLQRKSEWHSLDFFEQSDWKCAYFGIPKEQFKMVAWQ